MRWQWWSNSPPRKELVCGKSLRASSICCGWGLQLGDLLKELELPSIDASVGFWEPIWSPFGLEHMLPKNSHKMLSNMHKLFLQRLVHWFQQVKDSWLQQMLTFKRQQAKKELPQNTQNDWMVIDCQKNAWVAEEIMILWIDQVLKPCVFCVSPPAVQIHLLLQLKTSAMLGCWKSLQNWRQDCQQWLTALFYLMSCDWIIHKRCCERNFLWVSVLHKSNLGGIKIVITILVSCGLMQSNFPFWVFRMEHWTCVVCLWDKSQVPGDPRMKEFQRREFLFIT